MGITNLLKQQKDTRQAILDVNESLNSNNINFEDAKIINEKILNSQNEKTKFSFFKKLSFSSIPLFNNNYIYTNNKLFYKIGFSIGKIVKPINLIKNSIINGVLLVETKVEEKRREYLLIGQKIQVLFVKNKLSNEMKKNGFDFSTLLNNESPAINREEILKLLVSDIKNYGLNFSDNETFSNTLNNASSEEVKKEVFEQIIWKKLKEKISEYSSISLVINNLKNQDPFIKNIISIAKLNNITEESLINIINSDSDLLKNLQSGNKIFSELNKYINAINKYTDFTNTNIFINNFYLKNTTNLLETYFSNDKEFIEKISNENFVSLNGKSFSLKSLINNYNNFSIDKISKFRDLEIKENKSVMDI